MNKMLSVFDSMLGKDSDDWANMEISEEVSKEDAIKIMQANGFRIIYRNSRIGGSAEEIIFYCDETGAICRCCATEDNCCYGGFDINMAHKKCPEVIDVSIRTDKLKDYDGYATSISYHAGLINKYNECKKLEPIRDTTVLGYGPSAIPIPELTCVSYYPSDYKYPELMEIMEENYFTPSIFINYLYVSNVYENLADEDRWLYVPYMDTFWCHVIRGSRLCTLELRSSCIIMGAVLKVINMPYSYRSALYWKAYSECEELDESKPLTNGCKRSELIESYKNYLLGKDEIVDKLIEELSLDKLNLPEWRTQEWMI